jgi:hypothetical protein
VIYGSTFELYIPGIRCPAVIGDDEQLQTWQSGIHVKVNNEDEELVNRTTKKRCVLEININYFQ